MTSRKETKQGKRHREAGRLRGSLGNREAGNKKGIFTLLGRGHYCNKMWCERRQGLERPKLACAFGLKGTRADPPSLHPHWSDMTWKGTHRMVVCKRHIFTAGRLGCFVRMYREGCGRSVAFEHWLWGSCVNPSLLESGESSGSHSLGLTISQESVGPWAPESCLPG